MSQPFTFPPPPPPPPKRDVQRSYDNGTAAATSRAGFRGRGGFRSHGLGSRGASRGSRGNSAHGTGTGRGSYAERPRSTTTVSHLHNFNNSRSAKRDHSAAFPAAKQQNPQSAIARPKAPPAVPSFNVDIEKLIAKKKDAVPPESGSAPRQNLLGLTPARETSGAGSDSESEDDDAKMAASLAGDGMAFEHKGQIMSLRTPEEIAAWIAERKKRYPTQARSESAKKEAEEKQKQVDAQRKSRMEAAKARQEERLMERKERGKDRVRRKMIEAQVAKAKSVVADQKTSDADLVRQKADKLRKKAAKLALQLQAAEAALAKQAESSRLATLMEQVDSVAESRDRLTMIESDDLSLSDVSTSEASNHDDTSASGSSESDTDSGSDAAPEELSSHRQQPERRVAPLPVPQALKDGAAVCRFFLKTGKCKYGRKCQFAHSRPQRPAPTVTQTGRTLKKGLYQVMVDKEQAETHRRAVEAIIALGDRGLLDESEAQTISLPESDRSKDTV